MKFPAPWGKIADAYMACRAGYDYWQVDSEVYALLHATTEPEPRLLGFVRWGMYTAFLGTLQLTVKHRGNSVTVIADIRREGGVMQDEYAERVLVRQFHPRVVPWLRELCAAWNVGLREE